MPLNAFNPKGRAFVAKPFTFAGKSYPLDEEFPHKALPAGEDKTYALPEHELRGLWLADLIDFRTPEDLESRALVAAEEARIRAIVAEEEAELEAQGLGASQAAATVPRETPQQAATARETPKAKAAAAKPAQRP